MKISILQTSPKKGYGSCIIKKNLDYWLQKPSCFVVVVKLPILLTATKLNNHNQKKMKMVKSWKNKWWWEKTPKDLLASQDESRLIIIHLDGSQQSPQVPVQVFRCAGQGKELRITVHSHQALCNLDFSLLDCSFFGDNPVILSVFWKVSVDAWRFSHH